MVVSKISSCWVNTTSRRGIKQLGISIFLLFFNKSSGGGGDPRPPPVNDKPGFYTVYFFLQGHEKSQSVDLGPSVFSQLKEERLLR